MRVFARVAFFAVVLFLSTYPSSALAQTAQVIDEIVAVVGDRIILRSEVDGLVYGAIQQQQVPYSDAMWMGALNQLIDQKVMAIQAKKDTTIQVTDEQVDQALDARIQQLESQVGGQAQLEDLYGKSVLQIKDDLRDDFRDQLYAEQIQGRKARTIRVTPSEVREWFSRIPQDSLPTLPEIVRLAHIVRYPQVTDEARNDAMEVISALRDSIVNRSGSFEELARQFSDDPGSASNGGRDQGRRLTELVPEFAAVASRLPIGEVSNVFQTQFGLHILRVNDRKGDVIDYNHILVQFDPSKFDASAAVSYLNVVRDSLLNQKVPFELLARRHSEEVETASRGGRVVDPRSGNRDLPLQALGASWRNTISTLKEDETSEPAEVDLLNGRTAYHILQLQKRVPEHRVNIDTDYERIEQIVLQEKQQREMRRWLDTLREDVFVEMRGKAHSLETARS